MPLAPGHVIQGHHHPAIALHGRELAFKYLANHPDFIQCSNRQNPVSGLYEHALANVQIVDNARAWGVYGHRSLYVSCLAQLPYQASRHIQSSQPFLSGIDQSLIPPVQCQEQLLLSIDQCG